MRAIVFASVGKLVLEDRPEPEVGPKDVLIETAAVGVCGTDTHVFDGEFEGTVYPLVPGHEATGVVLAVGSGTSRRSRSVPTSRSTRAPAAVSGSSVSTARRTSAGSGTAWGSHRTEPLRNASSHRPPTPTGFVPTPTSVRLR